MFAPRVFKLNTISRTHVKSGIVLPKKNQLRCFVTETAEPKKEYENIILETKGKVAIITLNRPKSLNALCDALHKDVVSALDHLERDNSIAAVILTGSKKAFAAGADIKEMANKSFMDVYKGNMFAGWNRVANFRKPIIAAVNGYALGGGCELAMMCDIIIAGDKAVFGQPEITLGTIPGIGGTQRLVRAVGKSKAMELILTGKNLDAFEAEKFHLVSKVVPEDDLLHHATEMANTIASFSKPVAMMAKECVNQAYESSLETGLVFERRNFHATFVTDDQKEGMRAFINKVKPNFTDN